MQYGRRGQGREERTENSTEDRGERTENRTGERRGQVRWQRTGQGTGGWGLCEVLPQSSAETVKAAICPKDPEWYPAALFLALPLTLNYLVQQSKCWYSVCLLPVQRPPKSWGSARCQKPNGICSAASHTLRSSTIRVMSSSQLQPSPKPVFFLWFELIKTFPQYICVWPIPELLKENGEKVSWKHIYVICPLQLSEETILWEQNHHHTPHPINNNNNAKKIYMHDSYTCCTMWQKGALPKGRTLRSSVYNPTAESFSIWKCSKWNLSVH